MTGMRQLTAEDLAAFNYTRAELLALARQHHVPIARHALHHEVARALTAAGISLPPKRRPGTRSA